jgi:biopolymer transport protein ExbD
MPPRANRRRSFRHVVNCELELRPLMNVFIVLIPMLLMSAVFMEIRVIEMTLPQAAVAQSAPEAEPFDLAIRIEPDAYVVEANGAALARVARASASSSPSEAAAAQLASALAGIAAAHPTSKEVRIVAASTTRYQEIVAVMDIARAAGLSQAALEGAGNEGV